MNTIGSVSIVIPTKNSGRTLQRCLESITGQSYQSLEILVVDYKSNDNTIMIAEEFKTIVLKIEGERTKAKNFASRRASGEFLLFLDSDMVLEPHVIKECINAINDAGGVIIPEKSIGSGFWIKVRNFERSFYFGTRIESARFFRARDVMQVGGFDEDVITYEESTLPQKIEKMGLKTNVRISSFILHDEGTFKLKKWLKKKRYYSNSDKIYRNRYKEYSRYQLGFAYRVGIFLQNGKWLILLCHPILTAGLVLLKSMEFLSSKMK